MDVSVEDLVQDRFFHVLKSELARMYRGEVPLVTFFFK